MNAPAHAETAPTTAAWVPLATAAARPLAVLQLARPATGATAHKTKHYCRNPRCRSRLPEPVENEHRAFCTRGCYMLEGDGRYHLRTPIAIPRRTWAHLEEAKRRAESFALMAIPSAAVDPKLAARIKRDNEAPHPMGPPLNRPPLTSDAISSDWRPTAARDPGPIPDFLRRRR
jgi:hypothetical protein